MNMKIIGCLSLYVCPAMSIFSDPEQVEWLKLGSILTEESVPLLARGTDAEP